MKRLDIDFGTQRKSSLYRLGCVFFGVGVALSGFEGWRYVEHLQVRKLLEGEHARLLALIEAPVMPVNDRPSPSKDILERTTHAVQHLNAPWAALFEGVEAVMNEQVALLGMEPDLVTREVRLLGEAKNIDAMLQFVQRIDKVDVLNKPHLDSYQLHLQDPLRPVRFTLVARWTIAERSSESPRLAP